MSKINKDIEQQIIEYFYKNVSSREVAKKLNISKTSVLNVWRKHKLIKERLPQCIIDDVLKNYPTISIEKLAKNNNICAETVRKILRNNNIDYKTISKKNKEQKYEYIVNDYNNKMSIKEISKKYNISESSIRLILRKYNIVKYTKNKCRKDISEEDRQYIIDNYYSKKAIDLAKELNIPKGTITKIWFDNIKDKKKPKQYICLNEQYFKTIDSPEKAYWLGWIMSDGCIYKRNGHEGLLSLSIQKQDGYILQYFLNELQCNNPINIINNVANISIVNETIFQDLINIGVSEQKTWKNAIDLSNIDKNFYLDYTFGFFDGDGSIFGKNTPSSFGFSLCGNVYNMQQITDILKSNYIECTLKKDNREKYSNDFYTIRINSIKYLYVFAKLYTSVSYQTLKRKKDKFLSFINLVESNKTNRKENKIAVQYFKEHFM